MGHSNYELTPDQMDALDKFAEDLICKIESELANDIGGILDPYDTIDGKRFVGEVRYFEEFGSFGVVRYNAFETFQDLIEYDQFFNVVGNIFENEIQQRTP